jgi:hypothetical protein
MDTLYYSNYCKYSNSIKEFIVKKNLIEKLNCICVDSRIVEQQTGQIVLVLENGKKVLLPPNVHRVPSLIIRKNYNLVEGNDIIQYFESIVKEQTQDITDEPTGFSLTDSSRHSVQSEQYTFTDGRPQNRVLYVDANHSIAPIRAAPDDYHPNKVSSDVTIESLEKTRQEFQN